MRYSKSDLQKLSTNGGLKCLLSLPNPDFNLAIKKIRYETKLRELQVALIKLQNWVVDKNMRIIIIIEGGEFSGKGSAVRAFMERLNPRSARVVALPKPSKNEKGQWYFQRYTTQLPVPGEITIYDRSWYNRAVVEPVNGFCTKKEYKRFMSEVNHFERMIYNDGINIIKIFLSISKTVQKQRIEKVRDNPLRRWELSRVDENAQAKWNDYEQYQKAMFDHTNSKEIPWKIIDSNDMYQSHLDSISYALSHFPKVIK